MLIQADARAIPLRDGCVQCVVTSPPYWGGLRDYGDSRQFGLERDPTSYAGQMVRAALSEVHRVLRDDGVLWLNLGDVYAASGKGGGGNRGSRTCWATVSERKGFRMPPVGFKQKDLTLTPFIVASQARLWGWYLRATVIWRKATAAEPMRIDRPSLSHEYVFLLSKQEQYKTSNPGESWWGQSVWDIQTDADGTHPAAMPSELARRCIVASSSVGDVIFDPFSGSGTVLAVAERLGRRGVGTDLNPAYHQLAKDRTAQRGLRFPA